MSLASALLPIVASAHVFAGQVAPASSSPPGAATSTLLQSPGRKGDAHVADIAFRLAIAGHAHCPVTDPGIGIVLQHLSQFERADRAGMVTALALDRGPGVIVVVPGSPAATAGIRAGDVLLAVNGLPLPREPELNAPYASARAHARADAIYMLLARAAAAGPFAVRLLRGGALVATRITPLPVCPSRVHLARSRQRNAYADGTHVFMTTGLLAQLRNDDELAFLIAHEMAHNILGHAAIMRSAAVKRGLGRTLGRSGETVRRTERDADALAGDLMLDAGFDPLKGIDVLRRLGGSDFGITLFVTHAPTGERIATMRGQVQARQAR